MYCTGALCFYGVTSQLTSYASKNNKQRSYLQSISRNKLYGMDEVTLNVKKLKEIKSAKRRVESAIMLFGPANITSILDRKTFVDNLASIKTKLEEYIEKANKEVEELHRRIG